MAALKHLFIFMALLFCLSFSLVAGKKVKATFYNPPYTRSACFDHQNKGVMIAAAGSALYNKGEVCGKKFRVRNLQGGTHKEIVVTVVDLCPGCGGSNIDLSREAFASLAPLRAGRINIDLEPL